MTNASIRFLGHATVAIELDGVSLLTDPVLRRRVIHLRHHRHGEHHVRPPLPDAILISHIHHDHLDFPSLQRLGRDRRVIVPSGAGDFMQRRGFSNAEELAVGSVMRVGSVEIVGVPARHHGRRTPFGPTAACMGFVINGSTSIYFAGDTDLFPGMASLGPIELALLPVWGWGPTLGRGHLDPPRAAEALQLIQPAIAVPVHWGALFPLGIGRWRHHFLTTPPVRFAEYARQIAPGVRIVIVQPGETLALDGWQQPC